MKNDQNNIEIICPKGSHKEILSALGSWSYIILEYTICSKCSEK